MPDKDNDSRPAPDYVNALLNKGESPQNLMNHLKSSMAPVPGFKPPAVEKTNLCPLECSQEDANVYRSAAVFLSSLAMEVKAWRQSLPPNYQPAVIAVLHGGVQVNVMRLAQVSFDGIRIEGTIEGNPCTLFAHQSTVQMICYAMEIREEEPRNPIGFIWPDRDEEV